MRSKKRLARSASIRIAMLLCCSAIIPRLAALDKMDTTLLLQVAGGSVSADIRKAPLADVARELKMKTGATIHFQGSQLKDQLITAKFENVALEAALRAILENSSYVMITEPTEHVVGIQVYVYSKISEGASTEGLLAASERNMARQALDQTPQQAEVRPENPTALPPPVFNSDPAVRVNELEELVATQGPQSLAVVLAAVQDPDAEVRTKSADLLLNDLRDVVPRGDLATIAFRSERPEIRLQALEAMVEREDWSDHAHMTLDGMLHDTDPQIQQRAEELLLELSRSKPDSMQ